MTGIVGLLLLQAGGWATAPAQPTVGDTIWLARTIPTAAGWRVRAGKLEPTDDVEPLGDPAVEPSGQGWVVRYPVAVWRPGNHTLPLPPLWRLAPDGRADSSAGGTASFRVASVIPDNLHPPPPRGPLGPLRRGARDLGPPLAATLLAGLLLAAGVALRRRGPRAVAPPAPAAAPAEVADTRWLAAGEPKAVAARATWRLRAALARAVPTAHVALANGECLDVVAQARPKAPLGDLRTVLDHLERVEFAAAPGTDVGAIAAIARRLARELAP